MADKDYEDYQPSATPIQSPTPTPAGPRKNYNSTVEDYDPSQTHRDPDNSSSFNYPGHPSNMTIQPGGRSK